MTRSPIQDYLQEAEASGVAPHARLSPADQFRADAAAAARKAQRRSFYQQVVIGLLMGLLIGGALSYAVYCSTHGVH